MDLEPVEALTEPLVEERLIDLTATKLCRVRSVLAFLDGPRYRNSYENTRVFFQNPVPVEDDGRRKIGYATVVLEGTRLIADLAFEYASPERLGIETGSEKFYAYVEGIMDFESGSDTLEGMLDFEGYKRVVTDLDIFKIFISKVPPGDDRLEPLGSVVL